MKRQLLHILFIILTLSLSTSIEAEKSIKFKRLSNEQGLPGVSLQTMYQDSEGIMWFGIESSGLCRYDGNSFTTFKLIDKDPNSISNNFVTTIIEDKFGNLWVGTLNGLNKFNTKTYTFERYFHDPSNPKSIANNDFSSSVKDKYDNIWFSTHGGITIYNQDKNEFFNILNEEKTDSTKRSIYTLQLFESSRRDMYAGTYQDGLYIFSADEIRLFNELWQNNELDKTPNPLRPNQHFAKLSPIENITTQEEIWAFTEDHDGKIIIGTLDGLLFYQPNTRKFEHINFEKKLDILNTCTYADLYLDNSRVLWAGSTSDGLLIYNLDTKETSYFSTSWNPLSPIKSNSIRGVYVDKSGLIWIATKFEGLYIYDRRQEEFIHITENSNTQKGLSNRFVMCFYEDSEGILWIGTKNGGLNKYDPNKNTFSNYKTDPTNPKAISHNRIQYILEEDNDHLWIGTELGIEKFNKRTEEFKLFPFQIVFSLLKDGDKIWTASNAGVNYFDTKKEKFVLHKSKHKQIFNNNDQYITRIIKGDNNSLWIGSGTQGLFHYFINNDSLIRYQYNPKDSASISGNMIRGLLVDTQGDLWIGTKSNGLNKFDAETNKFTRIHCKEDLASRTIYNILEDNNRNLWMGTHNGIVKYDINRNVAINFNLDYGLQGKVFEVNSAYKLRNGNMLMGGQNGYNNFNPNKVSKHYYIAPLVISKFKIYDKIEDQNITTFKSYKLDRKSNYITLEFALLDYSKPTQNQYAYKLVPFDKDWVYCGNRSYASYTNLPSGKYTFKVKGANMDGDWNEEGLSIEIEIPAPIWEKLWFQFSVALLIMLFSFLIILARIKAAREREMRLKELVNDRTHALSKANQELTDKGLQISLQNKELVEHRINLEKLVKERTVDLELAKEKAEESDRLKSAFLANMSHEIRTPLNSIMGFSSLIASKDYMPDELDEMNEIIQSNGNALLQLINDIIDISMIEANQLEIVKESININKLLRNLLNIFNGQIKLKGKSETLKAKLSIPDEQESDDISIITDAERLKQILTNLFSNAIKFTEQGYIKFGYTISFDRNSINFFMEDTGIGIEKKYLTEIFERFRKIEDAKTTLYRGTGLGLSICSNLVKLLEGNIQVESKSGEGTKFTFSLPYQQIENIDTIQNNNNDNAIFQESLNLKNTNILIVEDEESNFKVMKAILLETEANIIWAQNGLKATEILDERPGMIDIILMDIKMPVMDGIEATKIIKRKHSVPIIAQTAYATTPEIRNFMQNGFDDYITKPIIPSALFSKLSKFLDKI